MTVSSGWLVGCVGVVDILADARPFGPHAVATVLLGTRTGFRDLFLSVTPSRLTRALPWQHLHIQCGTENFCSQDRLDRFFAVSVGRQMVVADGWPLWLALSSCHADQRGNTRPSTYCRRNRASASLRPPSPSSVGGIGGRGLEAWLDN